MVSPSAVMYTPATSSIASSGGFSERNTAKSCWRRTGPPKKSVSPRLRSFSMSGNTCESGIVVGLFTMRPTGPPPACAVTSTTASWKFGSGMSRRATRKIAPGCAANAAAQAAAPSANPIVPNRVNVRIGPF